MIYALNDDVVCPKGNIDQTLHILLPINVYYLVVWASNKA